MSVSTIGSASSGVESAFTQRKQDLESLVSAAQSGSQTSAKQALGKFEQDTKAMKFGGASGGFKADLSKLNDSTKSGSADQAKSSFAKDVASLVDAVKSGNTADAQAAATVVQSDIQSAAGEGHHHPGSSTDTSQPTSSTASTDSTSATTASAAAASTAATSDANSLVNSAVASYESN
jgi:hypothetical protein